jgi:Protein of unknown function (DUF5818)
MKIAATILTLIVASSVLSFADGSKTYVGVITDTMCAGNHAAMKVTPDAKCVKECVRDGKTFQYALVEGTKVYKLSDQETPARFAGQKVTVTGVLYAKTQILKVDRIENAR